MYFLTGRNPAVVDVDGRTKYVNSLKHALVLLQNQADQSHGFAGLAGAEKDAPPRGVAGDMEQHVAKPEHDFSLHRSFWPDSAMTFHW